MYTTRRAIIFKKHLYFLTSIILLFLTWTSNLHFGNHATLLFYIFAVAWTSNTVGTRYSYVYATIAAFLRILTPDVIPQELPYAIIWTFCNSLAAYVMITWLILTKNEALKILRTSSMTDPLTKICNRRGFEKKLEYMISHAYRYNETLSVAYIDIDNFKQVNDRLGHKSGDNLLVTVASTISKELRVDDIAARLGGDEFVIIFFHRKDASMLIKRIKSELDDVCTGYDVSFSIGVVHYDGYDTVTRDEMIHYADELMYKIKKTSKNAILEDNYKKCG